jgi:hypothetical protein
MKPAAAAAAAEEEAPAPYAQNRPRSESPAAKDARDASQLLYSTVRVLLYLSTLCTRAQILIHRQPTVHLTKEPI